MILTRYHAVESYRTKDDSEIRELMHPAVHGNRSQSLAEASVPPGRSTLLHRHLETEEIYHISAGRGIMTIGTQRVAVSAGDTVCIPAGTPHKVRNVGAETLRILCCCCPPYRHEDTQILDDAPDRQAESRDD